MRTIKFRGKNEKNWEWEHGFFAYLHIPDKIDSGQITIGYQSIPSIFNDGEGYREGSYWKTVVQKTVGQFTGAFDCEGREIYEGDIIHCAIGHSPNIYEITGVVEYRTCAFVLHYKGYNQDAYIWLDALIGADVIGNVYDNPEMLKGDSK